MPIPLAPAGYLAPVVSLDYVADAGSSHTRLGASTDAESRLASLFAVAEFELDEGLPPRTVQPWTRVFGHTVVRDGSRPFCSCGWSSTGANVDQSIKEHLREAWPVLMPRKHEEPYELWRNRVAVAHGEALEERERLWEEHEMGKPIRPGQHVPVIPEEWARADDRVEVLERQLHRMISGLTATPS